MVASPVWMFYESKCNEVVARSVLDGEDFTDIEIFPGDIPEVGDMIVANPDFSNQCLMKSDVFANIFKRVKRDKE